jgi:hypothetical protein
VNVFTLLIDDALRSACSLSFRQGEQFVLGRATPTHDLDVLRDQIVNVVTHDLEVAANDWLRLPAPSPRGEFNDIE